jgi:hypothetical protein
MGLRYILFRLIFQIQKKSKILKRKFPKSPQSIEKFISYENWKENKPFDLLSFPAEIIKDELLNEKANRILNGEILFFNREWKKLGLNYDWITNPDTNFKYDNSKHWTEINDFDPNTGDIKYVWEKSRFTHLLTLIRYDHNFGEDSSEFIFREIENWIDQNPINCGPNWICSQEISLRTIHWIFALDVYRNSEALTKKRYKKIINVIYWSFDHVFNNIHFSRIAVRNNHAITETLFLSICKFIFPEFDKSNLWSTKGRKWFLQEVDYQIYEDGSYIQFSMNYHRVLIQLLSFGIHVTEKFNHPLPHKTLEKSYKTLQFIYEMVQDESGKTPNYGTNDGAIFFNLFDVDYTDHRPYISNLHFLLTGKHIYQAHQSPYFIEGISKKFNVLKKQHGIIRFDAGGYYILRDKNSFTFIRCGNHRDRPAQADNLHLDIWINGENIIEDAGSYKYNTDKETVNYFSGTRSHNTVQINDENQMLKGGRFIWYYWSYARKSPSITLQNNIFRFEGEINAFRYFSKNTSHKRRVSKELNTLDWTIEDQLTCNKKYLAKQLWHFTDEEKVKFTSFDSSNNEVLSEEMLSLKSLYYGEKQKNFGIFFPFNDSIKTIINCK